MPIAVQLLKDGRRRLTAAIALFGLFYITNLSPLIIELPVSTRKQSLHVLLTAAVDGDAPVSAGAAAGHVQR